MGLTMQVQLLQQRPGIRAWLLMWLNSLAALVGLQLVPLDAELVQSGWRQIPDGHQSFDPALADHFKNLKMKNGKHINLAVSYSVVAKWNSSNKRRGLPEWTYGSDRHYADRYTDVDRKTWGQHMDDLARLGLVEVSEMKGKPAYRAVPYQILNAQLVISHAPLYGHDAQKHVHDAHTPAHHAQHITEESITEKSSKRNDLKPSSTPARDVVVDEITKPTRPEEFDSRKPEIPERRDLSANPDGEDELLSLDTHGESPRPIPPVSAHPPSPPDDDTDPDGLFEDEDELREFFNGCTDAEIKALKSKHGVDKIYATIKAAAKNTNIRNLPGFVRWQLAIGGGGNWRLPDRADPSVRTGADYVRGYEHLIEH